MSFPAYPRYKDSGVEWLGEVPEHWDIRRIKHIAHAFPSNVDKKSDVYEKPVLLCNYTDVYYNERITDDQEFMPATASDEQIQKFTLRADDTIITKDSETADDIAIAAYVPQDLPGVVCGYHLALVRPRISGAGAFLKRFFDSAYARSRFAVLANGLTRVGLTQYALDNVEVSLPPPAERVAITAFLDLETAKLNDLISVQRHLITLLKEKRQAVISHAVTKGLNPHAPLKPSDVLWVGDVPSHWRVVRLKHVVVPGDGVQMGPFGGMLLDLDREDTGFKVYGQENTISGDLTRGTRWISEARFHELSNYHLRVGDLVLTRKGSLGNAHLIRVLPQPGIADSDTIRIRIDRRIMNDSYLSLLLHEAPYVAEQIALTKRGAILPGLNTSTISELALLVPPLMEQSQLVAAVQAATGRFDTLISQAEIAIQMLMERRASLISAAVTGKIDVRGLAEAA